MKAFTRTATRWIALPVATVFAMVLSAVSISLLVDLLLRVSAVRDAIEIVTGLHGVAVACVTLLTANALAQNQRRLTLTLAFAFGAWAAWLALGTWDFPEFHPRAYQPSAVPLVMTIVGGLTCFAALWFRATPTSPK